ncbi:unnamed protein product [Heterobilharzia americana]|nr:unnamed protein product [Heterobilharzia americana]
MDFIHTIGIRFIHWMQTSNYLEPFFTGISHIGSPSTAYSLTFPSAYYINPTLGLITVLCTASSDWLNGIIKWILTWSSTLLVGKVEWFITRSGFFA